MKTLIFDMDDTLIVEEPSAGAAFEIACGFAAERKGLDADELHKNIRRCCRKIWHNSPARPYCVDIGISSWEALWAQFHGDNENLRILADWASTYRRNSWRDALAECGVEDDGTLAAQLAEIFIRERRKIHIVYDDVVPVLEHFRQRCKLGLMTNGAPDLQRRKLEGSGLEHFFDTVVISGEVGVGKPDTRIFQIALDRLSAEPEAAAMIGNRLDSDIAPALELGMTAIWLNRDDQEADDSIIPTAEIPDLTKLKDILE
ncbi:MAG: HAD family hydrolase [Planctomycetota bacterium]|jgi:putative hydrolase of the HAD superfamily